MDIKVIDAAKAHQGRVFSLGWDFKAATSHLTNGKVAAAIFVGQSQIRYNCKQYTPHVREDANGHISVELWPEDGTRRGLIRFDKVELL